MQKTADQSNKHTNQIISVTYICISLPIPNLGNDLVTELLLKSNRSECNRLITKGKHNIE